MHIKANWVSVRYTNNTTKNIKPMKSSFVVQEGFTLVELMVAIVLGLLVSAAALQIFYTSSVNARRQEAGSQIQDNAIFGLADLQYHLRRVNYGARSSGTGKKFFMNHLTPQGGIVLTAPTGTITKPDGTTGPGWSMGNLYGLKLNGSAINTSLLSHDTSVNSASNLAGINNSDQLTIQYQAGIDGTFDCQGRAIPKDYYVIERYFVRMDTTVVPSRNGLACASAIYKYEEALAGGAGIDIKEFTPPSATSASPNDLDGDGMIIVPNVDYFRVLLGVSSSKNFAVMPENAEVAYMPIPADPNTDLNNRRIIGMQLGLLTHSDNPTATAQENKDLRFSILDKGDVALNSTSQSGPTYLRNVYESNVLFRNARGGV